MSGSNSVLLKTDISSFYDSVSHEYLVDAVCRHVGLPSDCELMILFRRIIEVQVIHYSSRTGQIEGPHLARHGLPLGDGVEGYLANIYLKDVDDAMLRASVRYARYVDDIRIFGTSRTEVLRALRILQEELLRKGLNLNSSKTEIAEDGNAQNDLLSRLYAMDYYEDEDENAGQTIANALDVPLSTFNREFTERVAFTRGKDAKEFCKYLCCHLADGTPLVALGNRRVWHVVKLREVIVRWRGPAKHAAWLLVQTATYRGVPQITRNRAGDMIMDLLRDETVSAYARYRLMHHLIKQRQGRAAQPFRLLGHLTSEQSAQINALMESWLNACAFELNLIALYVLRINGRSVPDLRRISGRNCRQGCVPVRNAISMIAEPQQPPTTSAGQNENEEPDETPGPY